ncbi:MAG: hypothetical protein WDO70_05535 [Alphaproteobacteria bacterium]
MTEFVAERQLLCSLKGSDVRKEITIGISAPFSVNQDMVSFDIGSGLFACRVEVVGLDEISRDVYGMDSFQAIHLATDTVESWLRQLRKKYDIYFPNGDAYFDNVVVTE